MSPARRPPVWPVLRAVLVATAAALMFPAASAATTYTVTSTANSGAGTLAQAIDDANAHANSLNSGGVPDTVAFGLTGGAPYTIALTSELSHLTEAVVI